jgi:hypothetical protein
VVAQPHPGVDDLPDQVLVPHSLLAHHAERRDGAVASQDAEHPGCPPSVRPVVEGERDGAVVGQLVEDRRPDHDGFRRVELDLAHRRHGRRRGCNRPAGGPSTGRSGTTSPNTSTAR